MATVEIDGGGMPVVAETAATPALPPNSVRDAQGRVLVVRKVGPLERMRLYKAIGARNAENQQYLGYATLAYMVAKIDGDLIPPPVSEAQLEALVQRLGEDGFTALGEHQLAEMGLTPADIAEAGNDMGAAVRAAAARKQAEALAAAGNSPGTPA